MNKKVVVILGVFLLIASLVVVAVFLLMRGDTPEDEQEVSQQREKVILASVSEYDEWCVAEKARLASMLDIERRVRSGEIPTNAEVLALYEYVYNAYATAVPPEELQPYHQADLENNSVIIEYLKTLDQGAVFDGEAFLYQLERILIEGEGKYVLPRSLLSDEQKVALQECLDIE